MAELKPQPHPFLQDTVDPNLQDFGVDTNFYDAAYSWEPKRTHQFIMEVDGIPAYLIKTTSKPTIENGEIPLQHINIERYVKGRSKWSSINMTLYDPIMPSGARAVMDWVRLHHESATGRDGYASQYKKEIRLRQLSPLGEIIEEWILKGAYITSANFGGTLDWSDEGPVMIELGIRFDWAFFNF